MAQTPRVNEKGVLAFLKKLFAGGEKKSRSQGWVGRSAPPKLKVKRQEVRENELLNRQTLAAERSARWAFIAAVVALAALVIACWPIISKMLE